MIGPWRTFMYLGAAGVLWAIIWARLVPQRTHLHTDREIAWLIWHWFTGGKLERHKNAKTEDPDARFLIGFARTSAVAALVIAEYLRSGAPFGVLPRVLLVVGYGGALVAAFLVLAVVEIAVALVHRRHWVMPFYLAILKDAGWKPDTDEQAGSRVQEVQKVPPPRKIIRFPRAGIYGHGRGNRTRKRVLGWMHQQGWYRTARFVARWWHLRRDGVVVQLAPTFQPWDIKQRHVSEDALAKLGYDARAEMHLEGRYHHFQFLPAAVLPKKVLWSDEDIRLLMESHDSEHAPLLGCGHHDKPVRLSWVESPHMALSAGTGAGKSTLIAFIAAQVLFHGGIVTILDVRQNSHPWARDLVGVRYARKIGDIYDTALDIAHEVTTRGEIAGDLDPGEVHNWQRHLIVIEELNTLRPSLNRYYRTQLGGPETKAAPALEALTAPIFMGRDLHMNCLLASQRFQDKLLSGSAKDMFYGRLLARWEPNAWKDLAKGDWHPPDMHPGRAVLCYGQDERPIQMGLIEHPDRPNTAGNIRRWLEMPGSRWVGLEHAVPVGRRLSAMKALRSPEVDDQGNGHANRQQDRSTQGVQDEQFTSDQDAWVHGSPVPTGQVHTTDTGQMQQASHDDHGSKPWADGPRGNGQDHQHDGDGEGDGVHDDTIHHLHHEVKGGGGRENPRGAGVMAPIANVNTFTRTVPQQPHSQSLSGFSLPVPNEASIQGANDDCPVSGDDGGIEFVTLRDASRDKGRAVVPMRYDALRKQANQAGFPRPTVDNPVKSRRQWSTTALLDWFETRDDGEAGNYVIHQPGAAQVKIGETKNLRGRLRTWNYPAEWVRRWIPQPSKADAQIHETELHERFAPYHAELEWFWFCGELAEWLGEPGVRCGHCSVCVKVRV